MIQVGRIDKTQYGLKRNKLNSPKGQNESSLADYNLYTDKKNNNSYFRMRNESQMSFKGLGVSMLNNSLKPIAKPIPQKLTKKVFESLKSISNTQYEYYEQVRRDYVNFFKLHTDEPANKRDLLIRKLGEKYRKANGIPDEVARNISAENLYYLPQKSLPANFLKQMILPLKVPFDFTKKLLIKSTHEQKAQKELEKTILKDFASLQGLIKSHEIWENVYRKISGHKKWTPQSDFLIPDDVLLGKIKRRRNKDVDPNKGKFSSTSLMLGNRFFSGLVYAYFLGTDAYNTTMRYSNDEKEAVSQRNSRVAQEFSRIGIYMYIQNLLLGTFETAVNKSLAAALFASGATVTFSEVLGRKLVGKPIMPSDKETLDKMEYEMNNKKGVLPAIGRLLTNSKKKEFPKMEFAQEPVQRITTENPANKKLFASFTDEPKQIKTPSFGSSNSPSFKGFYEVNNLFDKKKLLRLIKIIEQSDSQTAEYIKSTVMKSVHKSGYFDKSQLKNLKDYVDLAEQNISEQIPVGHRKTTMGQLVQSIFIPVKFVKNLSENSYKGIRRTINEMSGNKDADVQKELQRLIEKNKEKFNQKYNDFMAYYNEKKELPVWKSSPLNEYEKEICLFKEFNKSYGKDSEEIEGVKNVLLWLEKELKKSGIDLNQDGPVDAETAQKAKKLLMELVLRADSSKQVEYDANVLSQANINMSRAITTLFLMADSYNLTMQYSNDNKKDAQKSASNRAAQEISRIGVSAYVMASIHKLLAKLCNSSLAGAFSLTVLTSSINDSLSRKVVGVPLTAKTQDELYEIDKENSKSKSPIRKALAYSIGKKSALPNAQLVKDKPKVDYYFENDYFITPKIV